MIIKGKRQKIKDKITIQNLKFLFLNCTFTSLLFTFGLTCFAQDIDILFTGNTHAMLYDCGCPHEPDGGIARRAAL
ncbi:MAG: hypothetical protein JW788_02645, partial [Candidatus Omnitrophica bacterium]|nr:hypothetical protein [Candidatus Omnitrophota bacterium]